MLPCSALSSHRSVFLCHSSFTHPYIYQLSMYLSIFGCVWHLSAVVYECRSDNNRGSWLSPTIIWVEGWNQVARLSGRHLYPPRNFSSLSSSFKGCSSPPIPVFVIYFFSVRNDFCLQSLFFLRKILNHNLIIAFLPFPSKPSHILLPTLKFMATFKKLIITALSLSFSPSAHAYVRVRAHTQTHTICIFISNLLILYNAPCVSVYRAGCLALGS